MKGEPLRHDFGHGEVAAYRWINADGKEGGIVAGSARVDDTAVIGAGATVGEEAVIGDRAVIGDGAIIGDGATIGYRAIIRAGAYIGYRAIVGADASIGYRVSIGDEATIGDGAIIEDDDWYITGGPCGSRKAMWTAAHSARHGLRWWIGCQHGISTEELLRRVRAEHGDNEHAQAYHHAVQCVTTHPEYLRRVAAQAEGAQP